MNLSCQKCKAPLDPGATGRVTCASCGHVSFVPPRSPAGLPPRPTGIGASAVGPTAPKPPAPRPVPAPPAPRPIAPPRVGNAFAEPAKASLPVGNAFAAPANPIFQGETAPGAPEPVFPTENAFAPAAKAPDQVENAFAAPAEAFPTAESVAAAPEDVPHQKIGSAAAAETFPTGNNAPAPAPDALDVLEDPFALRDPFAEPPQASPGPMTTSDAAATLVRPAPAPAPEPAEAPRAPATSLGTLAPEVPDDIDEDALLGRRKKGSLHPAALALIAAGAVFGGVAAFLLLRPAPAAPQIVYVTASASAAPAAPPSAGPTTEASVAAGDPAEAPKPGTSTRPLGGPWPTTAKTGTPAASIDMSGFQGPNVGGPTAGPTGGPQTAGTGQLSAGEISGVVEANRPLVKRRCWQPALDATKGMGGSSARVSASIVIAPSGTVQSVSASGAEKDYPGLSSCIASRIKAWKFPASGGSTPVNIPFVFAAQ
ncbi:AgmX/PglI C-terminal domain-containing protein [Polyangium sp. y55x31]|uniref:AgmX/PglI C-terminal domain-containing protein n=1 Tax=Polyangium sp. y55x31 TaxID=3042688 RepID=UPI0024825DF2|nr:AgmX/PglI C-terminal domain-containing protein [Polyangium sp. y55x31]MDI1481525.1 AgmX/PglI C-terminal domain-containing protein [Polyangium sp. y55x31]